MPEVKQAKSSAELFRILQFQYDVYVNEMGKKPPYADHEQKILFDQFDESATYFYTEHDGQISACLRLNRFDNDLLYEKYRDNLGLESFADYCSRKQMELSTRLMVRKKMRGSQLLGVLLSESYRFSRKQGIRVNFCFCIPSLVKLYQLVGYRKYKDNFMVAEAGIHTPLVFLLEDLRFLKMLRSPFVLVARNFSDDPNAGAWFDKKFPNHRDLVNERLMGNEEFWSFLETRHHCSDIPLFEGLTQSEIESFVGGACHLKLSKGEPLIRTSDFGSELFLVLKGSVEIVSSLGGSEIVICSLGQGDLIGEISFLTGAFRTADVRVTSDSEFLSISQSYIQKFQQKKPDIASKVLWNLSKSLAYRIQTSTQKWVDQQQGE